MINQNTPSFIEKKFRQELLYVDEMWRLLKKDNQRISYSVLWSKQYRNLRLNRYPHIFLSQNFISLFSLFEVQLNSITESRMYFENDEKRLKIILKESDIFKKLKLFIAPYSYDISLLDPEYTQLRKYMKVRHSLVHTAAFALSSKPKDETMRRFIQSLEGCSVQSSMWAQEGGLDIVLFTNKRFLYGFYTTVINFFRKWVEIHLDQSNLDQT